MRCWLFYCIIIRTITAKELARTVPTPIPRAVRRAERFIIDNAGSPITVSDVADHLGISLRSLETGFRQWRETTLNCVLAARSIGAWYDELLRSGA
jgi:AraC-like DNA-binding protein